MSEKKVEEKILLGSHLGDEFVHEVVTFCFEGKEGNLVLHVVLDWEPRQIRIETEHTSAAIIKRWMRCTNGTCANTHFVISR